MDKKKKRKDYIHITLTWICVLSKHMWPSLDNRIMQVNTYIHTKWQGLTGWQNLPVPWKPSRHLQAVWKQQGGGDREHSLLCVDIFAFLVQLNWKFLCVHLWYWSSDLYFFVLNSDCTSLKEVYDFENVIPVSSHILPVMIWPVQLASHQSLSWEKKQFWVVPNTLQGIWLNHEILMENHEREHKQTMTPTVPGVTKLKLVVGRTNNN